MKKYMRLLMMSVTVQVMAWTVSAQSNGSPLSTVQIYETCAPLLPDHQRAEYEKCSDEKKAEWVRVNCMGIDRNAEQYGVGRLSPSEEKWFSNCAPYMTPDEKRAIKNAPPAARRAWLGRQCFTPMKLPVKPSITKEEMALLLTLPVPMMRYNFLMARFDGLLSRVVACREHIPRDRFEAFFILPTIGQERSDWLNANCRPTKSSDTKEENGVRASPGSSQSALISEPSNTPADEESGASSSQTQTPAPEASSTTASSLEPPFVASERYEDAPTGGRSRRKGPAGWRIAAHITGWLGLVNLAFGIGYGVGTEWSGSDEMLTACISSIVIGGGLVIGATVATVKYAINKRRGLYAYMVPTIGEGGGALGVGYVF